MSEAPPSKAMKLAYDNARVIASRRAKVPPANAAEFAFPDLKTPGSCGASWRQASGLERNQKSTGGVKKKRLQGPCDPVIRRLMNVPWKLVYTNVQTGQRCALFSTEHRDGVMDAHFANRQISARQPSLKTVPIRGYLSTPRQVQDKF